ncbi:MAG: dihydropteroate synthase [Flavobacteriales bacterium]|nr:dihydropteroate synthase [Flavobacteriales bacterium]
MLSDKPLVMAILNLTNDSFHVTSRVKDTDIVERARSFLEAGASILDLGAASSRPGAEMPGEKEELDRLLPAIEAIRSALPDAVISIDTARSTVAKACVEAGADMINDIYAGRYDEHMAEVVGKLGVPYVMMHMQGTPQTMQSNPTYHNVTLEVASFFSERIDHFRRHGVADIILDPGFGFGKSPEHNFELIRNLSYFRCFELPIMTGISRKSSISKLLQTDTEGSLNGTTALHMIALEQGAKLLRVHDVKEAMQAITIYEACS